MAQGTLKSKPKPTSSTTKPTSHSSSSRNRVTKKGGRTVAPKKLSLIKAHKMTKQHSGGLTAQTEKMLGARAGHLEMLGGGKKKHNSKSGGEDAKSRGGKIGEQKKGKK